MISAEKVGVCKHKEGKRQRFLKVNEILKCSPLRERVMGSRGKVMHNAGY